MTTTCKTIAAVALLSMPVSIAQASSTVLLDFEGAGNLEVVGVCHNGGGGGQDLGASFVGNALALVDADAGGTGNIADEPSPNTVLFFLGAAAATLNSAARPETGFSFLRSASNDAGSITVYSEVDAMGDVLATLALPVTPSIPGGGDPAGGFNASWATGAAFGAVARSIDFGGIANLIAFDTITFGSTIPDMGEIPVPGTLPLLAGGLALAGLVARRRLGRRPIGPPSSVCRCRGGRGAALSLPGRRC